MREIKFRAWSEDFSQMIPWEELKFDKDENTDRICFYEQEDGSDSVWNGGADYKIMQYAGRKDVNRKEIYEGDNVKYQSDKIGTVIFERGSWIIKGTNYGLEFFSILEVVGNIFENPEHVEMSQMEMFEP